MLNLRRERKVFTEINVTPLVDVMLVLLVIFMVTAPLIIQSGVNVNLPRISKGKELPQADLLISIDSRGRIYLDEKPVKLSSLRKKVKSALLSKRHGLVIINADEDVKHGLVLKVLDAVKLGGARRLAVATRKAR
jgi:biopolymer transport protein ExbD